MIDGPDLVRRHALGLHDTTVRVLKGHEQFIACGATFVFLRDRRLIVKLSPEDSRRLIGEGKVALFEGLRSSRYGDWVEVDLDDSPPDVVTALIDLAYRRVMSPAGVAVVG